MSIADKISRLQSAKAAIAAAITNKGGTVASGDGFEDFSADIGTIQTQKEEQSKSMALGAASPATVNPDSGKALSSVSPSIDTNVFKAANIASGVTLLGIAGSHAGQKAEQSKTLQLGAAAPATVSPDSGKVLSSVTPSIDTSVIKAANIAQGATILGVAGSHAGQKTEQSKTVTPNAAGQTVTPDSGKVLSSVVINGDADLVAENVRSGIEIFGVTGTLEQLIPANCKYWAKGRISQGGNGKQGLMLKGDYQLTYGSNSTKIIAYVGASNFENGGVSLCADAASGGYNCRCVTLKGNYVDTYYNNVAQLGAILQTTGNANTSDFVLFYLVNGFTGQPTKADITQMADLKYVSSTSAVESTSAVLTNLQ